MKEKPTSLATLALGHIQLFDLRLPIKQGPRSVCDAMEGSWALALKSGPTEKAHGFGQGYCLDSVRLSYLV